MLGYVVCFLAGGYIIPASMHFAGIWEAENNAPDNPTWGEKFTTAFLGALMWPLGEWRFEAADDDDYFDYKNDDEY